MAKKWVRRFWSDDEKRMIWAQTRVPGVSVSQVARRYAMNAHLLFRWLKEPEFQVDVQEIDEGVFLPVEVSGESGPGLPALPLSASMQGSHACSSRRIEIATADGLHLTVEGGFNTLAAQTEKVLKEDPFSGHLFVFRGRRGDLLKIIWWNNQGACP